MCGGICNYAFVANLPLSLRVKRFLKSANIRGTYWQEFSVLFFLTHSVEIERTEYRTRAATCHGHQHATQLTNFSPSLFGVKKFEICYTNYVYFRPTLFQFTHFIFERLSIWTIFGCHYTLSRKQG